MVSYCMKDGKMAFYTFFVFREFAQKANKKCITIGPHFCTFANRNIPQCNCEKNKHSKGIEGLVSVFKQNIFFVTHHIKNNFIFQTPFSKCYIRMFFLYLLAVEALNTVKTIK